MDNYRAVCMLYGDSSGNYTSGVNFREIVKWSLAGTFFLVHIVLVVGGFLIYHRAHLASFSG